MKIGISTCGNNYSYEYFSDLAKNGIDCAEISLSRDGYDVDFSMIKENADRAGVEIWSLHLPFAPFNMIDPASLDEKRCAGTVEYLKSILKRAPELGCKVAVIHPSGEPYPDHEREDRLAKAQKTLALLADYAAGLGIQLAVENLPRTCIGRDSKEILAILAAVPGLRVCYDMNHLLSESAEDFIKACGDKIITVHVSDYDFLDERHWLPGEGKNDWKLIYNCLNDVGYSGPWLYELGFKAPASIMRERNLTPADFKKNAEEIFAEKNPAPFGTPVEGLKHWKNR